MALLCASQAALGASIALEWLPNPSATPIVGYRLYYGTAPGIVNGILNLGNVTSTVFPNLTEGRTYYFALSAVDRNQLESRLSTEISAVALTASPTPSPTPTAGFTVNIGPASRVMPSTGGDVTFPITITRTGSTASIFLNVDGLPAGSKPARFSTNPIQNSTSVTITFCSGVPAGSYPFIVTGFGCGGTGPPLTRTAMATLIKAP